MLLQLPEDVDVDLADLLVLDGEDHKCGDVPMSGRSHRKRALALAPPSLRAVVDLFATIESHLPKALWFELPEG